MPTKKQDWKAQRNKYPTPIKSWKRISELEDETKVLHEYLLKLRRQRISHRTKRRRLRK